MDLLRFTRIDEFSWRLEPTGAMRVPAVIYADERLIADMDEKVIEQLANVATLPGIVRAAYAMPDAHWGYGFPIGGVAAFDPDTGGVVSAGGVGFDVSCGVRLLLSPLKRKDIEAHQDDLADKLFEAIPAGVGSHGGVVLAGEEMDAMLAGGARWAVERGLGETRDLERIEERGSAGGAAPEYVSDAAKRRQRKEIGTLGSGNHYLEVQYVGEIFDDDTAAGFGLRQEPGRDQHPLRLARAWPSDRHGFSTRHGSECTRARHHVAGPRTGLRSDQVRTRRALSGRHARRDQLRARESRSPHPPDPQCLRPFLPRRHLDLLYDVSHNTCKEETHEVDGVAKKLFVHRKGATRAFGPGHAELPEAFRPFGQPVLIGGNMGVGSYVLAGLRTSEAAAFSSACHGAGRAMSRTEAAKRWKGRQVQDDLRAQGIIVKSFSSRGIAEEAPGAYKDVSAVAVAAEQAGLAKRVARLKPLICVKG